MSYKLTLLGAGLAVLTGSPALANHHSPRDGKLGELKFKFDSAVLPADAAEALAPVASYASDHRDAKLVLDAHTDPIGTSTYNVKLAIRRAESVRAKLTAMGVAAEQIVLAVYGEDGRLRASYADDRRVTIWPTREPMAALIDHTFAGKGTAVTWTKPLSVAQIEGTTPVASR